MLFPNCSCCNECEAGCGKCNPVCLRLTVTGLGDETGGKSGGCTELESLTKQDIILRRAEACDIKLTPFVFGNPEGTGAKVAVTLATSLASDYRYISSVSVLAAGSGYVNGAAFGYSLSCSSSHCNVAPVITLETGRAEPILTATVQRSVPVGGFTPNAQLAPSVVLASSEPGAELWSVKAIAVVDGGLKYTDGDSVVVSSGNVPGVWPPTPVATVQSAAVAKIAVARQQPSLSAQIFSEFGFASVSVSLQSYVDNGETWWGISSVSVPFQTGKFEVGNAATVSVSEPTPWLHSTVVKEAGGIEVSKVDQNGKITELTTTPGAYYRTDGSVAAVSVISGGGYYQQDGVSSATLLDGGKFFWDNPCTYTAGAGTGGPGGGTICAACPGSAGQQLSATLTLGYSTASLSVVVGNSVLLSATQSMEGKSCEGLSFQTKSVSATLSPSDCGQEDPPGGGGGGNPRRKKRFCEGTMPEQIELSLQGMGKMVQANPTWGITKEEAAALSKCGGWDLLFDCGPYTGSGQVFFNGGLIQQDGKAVLDLAEDDPVTCAGGWAYTGFLPSPPAWFRPQFGEAYSTGCDPLGTPVSVTISPTSSGTVVSISAPPNGGDAATAKISSISEEGGIEGVTVTSGGSGYAWEIIERQAPTITASVPSQTGSGGTFVVALTKNDTGPDSPTWSVSSVSVTNGGTNYAGNESVVFSAGQGDSVVSSASARIVVDRSAPSLQATAVGGTGASLSVALAQYYTWQGEAVWRVSEVAVLNGGSDYEDGPVTFTASDGTEVYAAYATAITARVQPTVSATVQTATNGTGAVISVVLTEEANPSGTTWYVSGLTATSGGAGYSVWDSVEVNIAVGDTEVRPASAAVTDVDEDGSILAITVFDGGSYFRPTGVIASVVIDYGGEYFKSGGIITSVVLDWGGEYFREQGTGQVQSVVPNVQFASATGSGANATATVDKSLQSETFGQVTAIDVQSPGEKYEADGDRWYCSISIPSLGHREILMGDEAPPEPSDNPRDCSHFFDKWLPFSGRVSAETCPLDLLQKSYKMWFESCLNGHFFDQPGGEDAAQTVRCRVDVGATANDNFPINYYRFYEFGAGEITCTISEA